MLQKLYYQESRMKKLAEDMAGRRAAKLSVSGVGIVLSKNTKNNDNQPCYETRL